MESIIMQWFQMMLDTFTFQLWVYGQWWAWAFIAIPAIVTTIASLIWMSLLTSPIWIALSGLRWVGNFIVTTKQKKN